MASWTPNVRKVGSGEREQLLIVSSLVKDNRLDEAESEVEKILSKNNRSFEATIAMGRILSRKRDFQKAIAFFERAVKLNPTQVQGPLRMGLSYLRMGNDKANIEKAQAAFGRALELDANNVRGHLGLARVLFLKEDMERALKHVRQALRADPANVQGRMLLARIQNSIGHPESAIGELETVVSLRPEQSKVVVQAARLYLKENNIDKAEEILLKALDQAPDPAVWDCLGRVRMRKEDYVGAVDAFQEVVRINPASVSVHIRLLDALMADGRTGEARQLLESLPRKRQIQAVVHKYAGDIFRAEERFKEAAEFYRAALLKTPGGEEAVASIERQISGTEAPNWETVTAAYARAVSQLVEDTKKQRRARRAAKPRSAKAPGARRSRAPHTTDARADG